MRKLVAALIVSIVFVSGLSGTFASPKAHAASGVNCDGNAVVYCGAASPGGLMNKYTSGDGVNSAASIQHIFSAFGISSSDMQNLGSTAQMGSVTRSGDVYVGNQLVAANALTAGRQNMAGSTRHMNQGTIFFTRPPSVSFASSPLPAFVVMKNGVFQFAILTSCGNPVIAHPKTSPPPAQPQQPQKPTPPAPAKPVTHKQPATKPAPAKVCSGNTTNTSTDSVAAQGGNCSTNTTTNNVNNTTTNNTVTQTQQVAAPAASSTESPPATTQETTSSAPNSDIVATQTTPSAETAGSATPAPAAATEESTPSSQPAATTLPNTGATSTGNLLGIFGITTVLGTIGYRFFLGRRYLRGL